MIRTRSERRAIRAARALAFVAFAAGTLAAQDSRAAIDAAAAHRLWENALFAGRGGTAEFETRRFALPASVVRSLEAAAARAEADQGALGRKRFAPISVWLEGRVESGDAPKLAGYRIVETQYTRLGGAGFVGEADTSRGLSGAQLIRTANSIHFARMERAAFYDLEATGEQAALDRWQRAMEWLGSVAASRRARISVVAVVAPAAEPARDPKSGAVLAPRDSYAERRARLEGLPGARTVGQAEREVAFGETLAFDWTKPYAYVAAYVEKRLGDDSPFALPELRTRVEGQRVELTVFPGTGSALALVPRLDVSAVVRPTSSRDVEVAGEKRRIELTEHVEKSWDPGVVRLPAEGATIEIVLPLEIGPERSVLVLLVRIEDASESRLNVGGVLVAGAPGEPVIVEAEGAVPVGAKLVVIRGAVAVGALKVRAVEGRLLIADLLDGEARRGDQVRR